MNTTNFKNTREALDLIESDFKVTESKLQTLIAEHDDVTSKMESLTTALTSCASNTDVLHKTIEELTNERLSLIKQIDDLKTSSIPSLPPGDVVNNAPANYFNITTMEDLDTRIKEIKAAVTDVNAQITIELDGGTYETVGIAPGLNWTIKGKGIDVTILKLKDVGTNGFHYPNNYVVATAHYGGKDPAWNNNVKIFDLTLDANWENQSARTVPSVKYGGVYFQSTEMTIERVKVVNWGSNGLKVEYSEAFPIFGVTYSSEVTKIVIQDCIVTGQHMYKGGYATAIMVQTMQPNAGDRIPYGSRKSTSAIIKRNRAYNIYGHGYGVGWSENVIFEDNDCIDSKTGTNIDTGRNRNIVFKKNRFLLCNQGVHFGNSHSGEFKDFVFEDNYFLLTVPFYNAYLVPPKSEYAYGIRASGNTFNTKISKNKILSGCKLKDYNQGIYGIGLSGKNEGMDIANNNEYGDIVTKLTNTPAFYM